MQLFFQIAYDFLLIFVPLAVAVDPAGVLPLFLALTEHHTEPRRRRIAARATFVAAVTGVTFIIIGQAIFSFLGINFADFQIAGGILLAVLAIIDLLSRGKPSVDEEELQVVGEHGVQDDVSFGIVPLAVPLIVGPATLTTSLLLVSTYSAKYEHIFGPIVGQVFVMLLVSLALLLNLLIIYLTLRQSGKLLQIVGRPVMAVINKIVMILLMAIAVALIRQGITSIVRDLKAAPPTTKPAALFVERGSYNC